MASERVQLTNTGESGIEDTAILPHGDELRERYRQEIVALNLPNKVRFAHEGESPNTVLPVSKWTPQSHSLPDIQLVHEEFIKERVAVAELATYSWWLKLRRDLTELAHEDNKEEPVLRLNKKYVQEITYDGVPIDQYNEIYEVGDPIADRKIVTTVFHVMHLIDQLSGGLVAADIPNRMRIVLSNGYKLESNNGGDEVKGFAEPGLAVLNISGMRETANRAGIDVYQLVSDILVHEVLGHGVEMHMYGTYWRHFEQYFEYSNERVKGEIFQDIHKSITPIESGIVSHPVSEYGYRNCMEDLATSMAASVSRPMGWTDVTDKLDTTKSTPDSYRRDLSIDLLEAAAQKAHRMYDKTPGFIGSELIVDQNGMICEQGPRRSYRVISILGSVAVEEEIKRVVADCRIPKEFTVRAPQESQRRRSFWKRSKD